jgi:hypothetical protein
MNSDLALQGGFLLAVILSILLALLFHRWFEGWVWEHSRQCPTHKGVVGDVWAIFYTDAAHLTDATITRRCPCGSHFYQHH